MRVTAADHHHEQHPSTSARWLEERVVINRLKFVDAPMSDVGEHHQDEEREDHATQCPDAHLSVRKGRRRRRRVPLGFSIVGGSDSPRGPMPVFVRSVFGGGLARRTGLIRTGDELLAVNGCSLVGVTHSRARQLIRLAARADRLSFRLRRPRRDDRTRGKEQIEQENEEEEEVEEETAVAEEEESGSMGSSAGTAPISSSSSPSCGDHQHHHHQHLPTNKNLAIYTDPIARDHNDDDDGDDNGNHPREGKKYFGLNSAMMSPPPLPPRTFVPRRGVETEHRPQQHHHHDDEENMDLRYRDSGTYHQLAPPLPPPRKSYQRQIPPQLPASRPPPPPLHQVVVEGGHERFDSRRLVASNEWKKRKVTLERHRPGERLGMGLAVEADDVSHRVLAVWVEEIDSHGPADTAGLRRGDRLVKLEGIELTGLPRDKCLRLFRLPDVRLRLHVLCAPAEHERVAPANRRTSTRRGVENEHTVATANGTEVMAATAELEATGFSKQQQQNPPQRPTAYRSVFADQLGGNPFSRFEHLDRRINQPFDLGPVRVETKDGEDLRTTIRSPAPVVVTPPPGHQRHRKLNSPSLASPSPQPTLDIEEDRQVRPDEGRLPERVFTLEEMRRPLEQQQQQHQQQQQQQQQQKRQEEAEQRKKSTEEKQPIARERFSAIGRTTTTTAYEEALHGENSNSNHHGLRHHHNHQLHMEDGRLSQASESGVGSGASADLSRLSDCAKLSDDEPTSPMERQKLRAVGRGSSSHLAQQPQKTATTTTTTKKGGEEDLPNVSRLIEKFSQFNGTQASQPTTRRLSDMSSSSSSAVAATTISVRRSTEATTTSSTSSGVGVKRSSFIAAERRRESSTNREVTTTTATPSPPPPQFSPGPTRPALNMSRFAVQEEEVIGRRPSVEDSFGEPTDKIPKDKDQLPATRTPTLATRPSLLPQSAEDVEHDRTLSQEEEAEIATELGAERSSWYVERVRLRRDSAIGRIDGSVGLLIGASIQHPEQMVISRVVGSSIADQDARIQRNDRLFFVQGRSTHKMDLADARLELRLPAPFVDLVVGRRQATSLGNSQHHHHQQSAFQSPTTLAAPLELDTPTFDPAKVSWSEEVHEVELRKGPLGVGLALDGGADKQLPVFVKRVFPGSTAAQSGKIKAGDAVVSIGDRDLAGLGFLDAWRALKEHADGEMVRLKIRKATSI